MREEIAAVLLAAGRSLRFGEADKLLAPLTGRPLILHTAAAITELHAGWQIAVCNEDNSRVISALSDEGFEIVTVDGPDAPMSASLAVGVRHARNLGARAVLLCLGDMPFVTVEHLRALIDAQTATNAPVVASGLGGVAMPPALFSDTLFDQLLSQSGEQGARGLLRDALCVEAADGTLRDIDTPEDLGSAER